ncbi:MAG: pinensin family lanthipeptide [Cyclobacteriaceae bacterium]
MKKIKIKLHNLKVKSFVTKIDGFSANTVKGGYTNAANPNCLDWTATDGSDCCLEPEY